MRVDVVDLLADGRERHLHAAHRALSRGLNHVIAVGSRAVADHFAIDPRPARLGVFQFLENEDARTAGDDETVAVLVVGARGLLRPVVEVG